MKGTPWTTEQLAVLTDNYPVEGLDRLCELLPGKTRAAIRSRAKLLGLRKRRQKFRFTSEQVEIVRREYATCRTEDLANRLGCAIYSVYNLANRLGLKKDQEFLRELFRRYMDDLEHPGRRHQFSKGQAPPNKGKKWGEFMSPEAQAASRRTCFKKGSTPKNTLPDWTITMRQREDRNEAPYQWIKHPQRGMIMLQKWVWEQNNGAPPKGMNVVFKDGDTMNCDISNLELVSDRELMIRNSVQRLPEDVRKLIHVKGALNRQINKRLKNEQ